MAGESQQTPKSEPDPSVLSTDQLMRMLRAERDYTDGQVEVLQERLRGMDEATKVLHETVTRVPTDMQLAVGHLRDVMDEKFGSVNTRFVLNDDRSKSEGVANEVKVNAAFAASKEASAKQDDANQKAIDKSEKTTKEVIDKNSLAAEAANKALADKVEDQKDRTTRLEDRMTRQEARDIGRGEQRSESRDTGRYTATIIGAALAVAGIVSFLLSIKR